MIQFFLAAGLAGAGALYYFANKRRNGRRLVRGVILSQVVTEPLIKAGLEQNGFTEMGPVNLSDDSFLVYAKHPSPDGVIASVLPLTLNVMGQPAFIITDYEGVSS